MGCESQWGGGQSRVRKLTRATMIAEAAGSVGEGGLGRGYIRRVGGDRRGSWDEYNDDEQNNRGQRERRKAPPSNMAG